MSAFVIVTGASGFIGSNLASRLRAEGFAVGLIIRSNSNYLTKADSGDDFEIFAYDGDHKKLLEWFLLKKPRAVFHLASRFLVQHRTDDIDDLVTSNISFGLHLLESCRISGCAVFLNAGTIWQEYMGVLHRPVNLYAATKEAFAALLNYYSETYGIKFITLKLCDTYGTKDPRNKLINIILKAIKKGENLEMSPGEQLIDLVHVDDVVEAFVVAYQAIEKQSIDVNREYAVNSNLQYRLKDLVQEIKKIVGKSIVTNFGARPYREREVMIPIFVNQRLPNWEPKVSLEKGIRQIYQAIE